MSQTVSAKLIFSSPQMFLAFGFGSGLSRYAPGTMGTLAALPLYLLLAQLPVWAYALCLIASTILGIYLCAFASKTLGVHDHSGIVWDEVVGIWITMFMVPFDWKWIILGFVLFRLFDIVKPWPISVVDKHVHGGFGIMADDVLAGIAAWACLQGLILII